MAEASMNEETYLCRVLIHVALVTDGVVVVVKFVGGEASGSEP